MKKTGMKKTMAALLAACALTVFGGAAASANENFSGGVSGPQYGVHVDSGYLTLRSAIDSDISIKLGELYNDDSVMVIDSSDPDYWYVYSQKYDTFGYVNRNYVYRLADTSGALIPQGTVFKVNVKDGYLGFRNAPVNAGGQEIGRLNKGDTVTFMETTSGTDWVVFSQKHNRIGYVNSSFLTR